MKPEEIVFGGLYRAKRPKFDFFGDVQNDRAVIYIDHMRQNLQYDSYTVASGRHYPSVSVEAFARWAKCRINEDGTPYEEPKA